MLVKLFCLQLIAHFIADFYLQTDSFCKNKERDSFCGRNLWIHAFVVFFLSWFLSFNLLFYKCALFIAFSHLVIDGLKKYFNKKYSFIIDQIIHLSIIILVIYYFRPLNYGYLTNEYLLYFFNIKTILYGLGVILCWKPSNIFIKSIFDIFTLKFQGITNNDCLPNAGRLIGNLERLLVFTFVVLGKYEVVGFILAAKSVLRFSDKDTAKSEYVLVGTFLSFTIAIFLGLIFLQLVNL